jgi:hypothetical protein
MFVEGSPQPMSVTFARNLQGQRSAAPVVKALEEHLNKYRRKDIFAILSDREGAIGKLRDQLMQRGIIINVSAAGVHVPVVERKITVIKERVRGILATLPFSLLKYLVAFAVSNLIPANTHVSGISPKQ